MTAASTSPDESGCSLENVFMALKMQNTDHIADSVVSDKYSELIQLYWPVP